MTDADDQLDSLNQLLHEMSVDHDGLTLSEYDGLVAGVLVCAEMIPPSEWLPIVFGGDALPKVDSLNQAQDVLAAVMAHYNDVASGLAKRRPTYEPIFEVDPNESVTLWEPWVEGFERAMRLRPDSWLEMVEAGDEKVSAAIPFILELHRVYHGQSELDVDAIDRLDEVAPDLIPSMVLTLNRWTKTRATKSPADQPARAKKTGRNEPCPCGSGKKYKKCCGAVTLH